MVFSIALSVPAMESMCMAPIWCNLPWSTETNAAWAQAFGLFITFGLQVGLLYLTLREQREARLERRAGEVARQRGDTTCAGVASILRSLTQEDMCKNLWAGNCRHGGFAFEKGLYFTLPEYLLRKCESFKHQIEAPITLQQNETARFLLVFQFPYPKFEAVLNDVERLNFGKTILVWDDSGKPIKIRRD